MMPTDDAEFDDDKKPAQRTKQVNQTSTPPRKIPMQSSSPQDTNTISNPPSAKKEPDEPSIKNPSPFHQEAMTNPNDAFRCYPPSTKKEPNAPSVKKPRPFPQEATTNPNNAFWCHIPSPKKEPDVPSIKKSQPFPQEATTNPNDAFWCYPPSPKKEPDAPSVKNPRAFPQEATTNPKDALSVDNKSYWPDEIIPIIKSILATENPSPKPSLFTFDLSLDAVHKNYCVI